MLYLFGCLLFLFFLLFLLECSFLFADAHCAPLHRLGLYFHFCYCFRLVCFVASVVLCRVCLHLVLHLLCILYLLVLFGSCVLFQVQLCHFLHLPLHSILTMYILVLVLLLLLLFLRINICLFLLLICFLLLLCLLFLFLCLVLLHNCFFCKNSLLLVSLLLLLVLIFLLRPVF